MAITQEAEARAETVLDQDQRRALLDAARAVLEPEISRVLERLRAIYRRQVAGQG